MLKLVFSLLLIVSVNASPLTDISQPFFSLESHSATGHSLEKRLDFGVLFGFKPKPTALRQVALTRPKSASELKAVNARQAAEELKTQQSHTAAQLKESQKQTALYKDIDNANALRRLQTEHYRTSNALSRHQFADRRTGRQSAAQMVTDLKKLNAKKAADVMKQNPAQKRKFYQRVAAEKAVAEREQRQLEKQAALAKNVRDENALNAKHAAINADSRNAHAKKADGKIVQSLKDGQIMAQKDLVNKASKQKMMLLKQQKAEAEALLKEQDKAAKKLVKDAARNNA